MDTWILLRDIETTGERNRGLHVLKSRGMAHSNQIREFLLTSHGIELVDPYLGPSGVLTGSARLAQEAQERAELVKSQQEIERDQRGLDRKRAALEAQIAALRAQFEADEAEANKIIGQQEQRAGRLEEERIAMAASRKATQSQPRRGRQRKESTNGRR
jgi:circadian clock protein KaiC